MHDFKTEHIIIIFLVLMLLLIGLALGIERNDKNKCIQSFTGVLEAQKNALNSSLKSCQEANKCLVIKKVDSKKGITDIAVECKLCL